MENIQMPQMPYSVKVIATRNIDSVLLNSEQNLEASSLKKIMTSAHFSN